MPPKLKAAMALISQFFDAQGEIDDHIPPDVLDWMLPLNNWALEEMERERAVIVGDDDVSHLKRCFRLDADLDN